MSVYIFGVTVSLVWMTANQGSDEHNPCRIRRSAQMWKRVFCFLAAFGLTTPTSGCNLWPNSFNTVPFGDSMTTIAKSDIHELLVDNHLLILFFEGNTPDRISIYMGDGSVHSPATQGHWGYSYKVLGKGDVLLEYYSDTDYPLEVTFPDMSAGEVAIVSSYYQREASVRRFVVTDMDDDDFTTILCKQRPQMQPRVSISSPCVWNRDDQSAPATLARLGLQARDLPSRTGIGGDDVYVYDGPEDSLPALLSTLPDHVLSQRDEVITSGEHPEFGYNFFKLSPSEISVGGKRTGGLRVSCPSCLDFSIRARFHSPIFLIEEGHAQSDEPLSTAHVRMLLQDEGDPYTTPLLEASWTRPEDITSEGFDIH